MAIFANEKLARKVAALEARAGEQPRFAPFTPLRKRDAVPRTPAPALTATPAAGVRAEELESEPVNGFFRHAASGDMCLKSADGRGAVYRLCGEVFARLYPYQRECVAWLWGLHCQEMGECARACLPAREA
jgi:hypothetical protein